MNGEIKVDPLRPQLPNDGVLQSEVLEVSEESSILVKDDSSPEEISASKDTNPNSDLPRMESQVMDYSSFSAGQNRQEEDASHKNEQDESRAIYGWQYSFPYLSTQELKNSLEKCSNFIYIPPEPSVSQLSHKSFKATRRLKRPSPEIGELGICIDILQI